MVKRQTGMDGRIAVKCNQGLQEKFIQAFRDNVTKTNASPSSQA
jgi:hypothetical protein